MGRVLVGYDEDLHREVAIKLLHGREHPRGRLRLMREAQALARLSHPNVVQIHEVGQHQEAVFLAMELVEGETLRQWAPGRSWPEILGALLQAGRGLEAAHRAGLVHRDFKPDNVLVGTDGRVRLLDFGLARGWGESSTSQTTAEVMQEKSSTLRATLTDHGSVVGTPVYMAPEQHSGHPCDASADQFAFCVSAFELFFGSEPFPQRPVYAMALAKSTGELAALPAQSPVPRNLRMAIVRGLAADPGERWADMGTLLGAFEAARPGVRRRWLPLTLGMVLAGGIGISALIVTSAEQPCVHAGESLAEVWSATRRDDVVSAAPEAIHRLAIPTLDRWVDTWVAAAVTSCEDVHVHQQLSPQSLDRRGACLARRRAEFEAVVDGLARGEVTSDPQVVEWLGQLEPPQTCLSDAILAGEWTAIPEGREDEVAAIRRDLVAVELRHGSMRERVADADALLGRSRDIGWQPLIGEASLTLGRLHTAVGEAPAARTHLGEALDLAEATRDVEQQALVWSALNQTERLVNFDSERAMWMWHRQAAVFDGVEASVRQRAQLHADLGQTQELAGDIDAAEKSLVQARTLLESIDAPPAWQLATVLHNLANLLAYTGRAAEAEALFERARALELGGGEGRSSQPQTAGSDLDRGIGMIQAGNSRQAIEYLEHALATAVVETGPRSELVARFHVALAAAHAELDSDEGLRIHAEKADELTATTLGSNHPLRVDVLSAVGESALRSQRFDASIRAFEASLRLVKRLKPPDSIPVALAEYNLADALQKTGEHPRAAELLAHALPRLREGLGAEHPLVVEVTGMLERSRNPDNG